MGKAARVGDHVVVQIDPSYQDSRVDAAAVLDHELAHVKQYTDHGYDLGDAAPFISRDEFIALTWRFEAEAYDAAAKALEEISKAGPEWKNCVDNYLQTHSQFAEMTPDERAQDVSKLYPRTAPLPKGLEQQYEVAHDRPVDNPAIKERVDADSTYREQTSSRWQKYLQ
jgi:hypothetical protein